MQIAVTGASGLVGSALVRSLESEGHSVRRLVRSVGNGPDSFPWDPQHGRIDPDAINGTDAVVHLAGANIAAGRWTEARRRLIRDSRVHGTRLIARAIADARVKPRVLVSASAIGYYGDRGEDLIDESATSGSGFLAKVCEEWELAARDASAAGVRVVWLRTGIVLSPKGGALGRLLPVFRAGLGGPISDGRMWMSWITIDDLVRAIGHLIADVRLEGPVNAVTAAPVMNREFSKALGKAVRRPAFFRIPAWVLRLALGQMADEAVLASARVHPRRLLESAFEFKHPEIGPALEEILGSRV